MSDTFVNQVTLDCLLNKKIFDKHVKTQKSKSINKEERKFYKKRIFNLFKNMITENEPSELLPDVKYSYDNFVISCIHYFKTIDKNDLLQAQYNDLKDEQIINNILHDKIEYQKENNLGKSDEADKLLMRSIKIDRPTLDKYVTRIKTKKEVNIILPKQKNIDLLDPEFRNKGL